MVLKDRRTPAAGDSIPENVISAWKREELESEKRERALLALLREAVWLAEHDIGDDDTDPIEYETRRDDFLRRAREVGA